MCVCVCVCHASLPHRDQVAPKYKKKIELMVRKPEKDPEELEEPLVECCFCNLPGPETELQCFNCQNIIPFDISTGARSASVLLCASVHMLHFTATLKHIHVVPTGT